MYNNTYAYNLTNGEIHDNLSSYFALLLLLLSVLGFVGNSSVMLSIYCFRFLQKPCNYLIGSLAAADVFVCIFIMPLATYQEVGHGAWHLGKVSCNLYLCVDVILTSATIWNLALISLDRYLAITKPFWYSPHRTVRNAVYGIIIAWATPVVLSVPAGFLLDGVVKQSTFYCIPKKNAFFYIFSAVVAFYIPCSLMVAVYFLIWKATRRLESRRKERQHFQSTTTNSGDNASHSVSSRDRIKMDKLYVSSTASAENPSNSSGVFSFDKPVIKRISLAREKRAAVVMCIVLMAFISCWLPFFCFITVHGILITRPLGRVSFQLVHWLGWFNSTLNPLVYASLKHDFQRAFKRLWSDCRNKNIKKNGVKGEPK